MINIRKDIILGQHDSATRRTHSFKQRRRIGLGEIPNAQSQRSQFFERLARSGKKWKSPVGTSTQQVRERSSTYHKGRGEHLTELYKKHGVKEWLVHNYQQERILQQLEQEVEALKQQRTVLNRERKTQQVGLGLGRDGCMVGVDTVAEQIGAIRKGMERGRVEMHRD